ncbi:unnamed protein product [Prorocentrum cordatum]|uniref:Uncharacterized protein n=1 Tax=Prorocentrum cordatum TaxID=2364126 RepID=A0ABN9UQ50_9DINO|nr:unnamed protein product [Polarella glacialis]
MVATSKFCGTPRHRISRSPVALNCGRKRERERERERRDEREREMEREERGSEHDPRARARQPVTPTTPNETVKPAMPSGSRPAPQSKW